GKAEAGNGPSPGTGAPSPAGSAPAQRGTPAAGSGTASKPSPSSGPGLLGGVLGSGPLAELSGGRPAATSPGVATAT
ncbi:hypothetical protein J0670_34190, partial [Streptomyces sp. FH025]|nr:hypothetical protein [Streptomyces sp. FH025]